MTINYNNIPPVLLDAINAYAQRGVPPGGFLEACLANDLRGAFARADNESLGELRSIVAYIYNFIPADCHGSRARVDAWIRAGGADGLYGDGVWEPETRVIFG